MNSMKAKLSLLALAVYCSGALAQAPEGKAGAAALEVNPFTGKPLSVEQIQRELEDAKIRTQLLEEALKQTNLRQEINTVPLRKAVEAAQAKTAVQREASAQDDMAEAKRSAAEARQAAAKAQAAKEAAERKAAQAEAQRAAKLAAKKKVQKTDEADEGDEPSDEAREVQAAKAAAKPVLARPSLSSVMDLAGSRSAVLAYGDNVLVVQDGGMTPSGPLKVVDMNSVEVNGEVLRVHSATLSRFVVSDPKPVDPAMAGRSGPAPVAASAPVVKSANEASPAANPAPAGQRSALPPLQLPPGVSVLPPSTR